MEMKLRKTEHCEFWIAEPGESEVVRPLVHVGDAESYFSGQPNLVAMVNGTFFNAGHKTPYVLGDVKTDLGLVWDSPLKAFNIQSHAGHQYYWSPAAGAPGVAGYQYRWAMAVDFNGAARLVQGNQCSFNNYKDDAWVIGGGLLLLKGDRTPFNSDAELDDLEFGEFGSGQTYPTRRSMLMMDSSNTVHLGVNRSPRGPRKIALGLLELGYQGALMLDGGGAAALGHRDGNGTPQFKIHHNRKRYPVLHSAVGILR